MSTWKIPAPPEGKDSSGVLGITPGSPLGSHLGHGIVCWDHTQGEGLAHGVQGAAQRAGWEKGDLGTGLMYLGEIWDIFGQNMGSV